VYANSKLLHNEIVMENNKKRLIVLSVSLLLLIIVAILYVIKSNTEKPVLDRIGYDASPLLAPFFYAVDKNNLTNEIELQKLRSSSDIGYALLSKSISAGFVEPFRLSEMKHLKGFEDLQAVGGITFPYGVSVVVRKGLQIRLQDLKELVVAVSDQDTKLLGAFIHDVARFNITFNEDDFTVLSSDAILPALETGAIDAVVLKATHAILAQIEGHSILYQKWDVEPGDECCPPIVDQLVYVLVVQKEWDKTERLQQLLLEASNDDTKNIRKSLQNYVAVPASFLDDVPIAKYEILPNENVEILEKHAGRNHQKEKSSISKQHFVDDKDVDHQTCGSSCTHHRKN
jgi:ABC-type nitrate/sulfonate/bicarbonate transport system substrate-binding protein